MNIVRHTWYSIVSFLCSSLCNAQQHPIVVVVPSYNNIVWYEQNLDSLRAQRYDGYHILYIDDGSTDGTADAVAAYIEKWHLDDVITLIRNPVRCGSLYNIYTAVHCCPDNAIVAVVDGDDWLAHAEVLAQLNEIYQNPEIWMTYGQFEEYPSGNKGFCKPIPAHIKRAHAYRYHDWISSHLKTFYAGLFKKIPLSYFVNNGAFLRAACDVAFMLPMLELSGGRAACIDEILYIYNMHNLQSVCRTRPIEQLRNSYWVRSRQPLSMLMEHPGKEKKSAAQEQVYNLHFSIVSASATADYLATVHLTDIDFAQITVYYAASPDNTQYQKLANDFDITLMPIDAQSKCKNILLDQLSEIPASAGVIITLDGCRWIAPWSGIDCLRMLNKTHAICFATARAALYARPPLVQIEPSLWIWKCSEVMSSWHMPHAMPGTLYRGNDLRELLSYLHGMTIKECMHNLFSLPPSPDTIAACGTEASSIYHPNTIE